MTGLLVATGDGVARIDVDAGAVTARALEGARVQCVASDPARARVAYAGCRGQGLWRSEDGGAIWEDCALPAEDVFSVAISPVDGRVYAGCEPSMLFASVQGNGGWEELETLRAIPSAPRWSFPPRPWTSHVRWIAPSPHEAGLLLVGIELGGVMRTEDGGRTWQDHRPGAKLDAHELAWHPLASGRAYEAAGDGAAWSVDGGETWTPADSGRNRGYVWALAVDPLDPDTWYVSASPGPYQAHGERHADAFVYRWRGSGPWEPLEGALSGPLEVMPYALAASADELVVGMRDGRVFVGEDYGDGWRLVGSGPLVERIVALCLVA